MIKSLITLIALLFLSSMATAAGQATAAAHVDSQQASPAKAETTAPTTAKEAAQQAPHPDSEHLPASTEPAKKESLKAAVNRAIKVFVPSEKIDVDKPVDFPTNI